MNKFYCGVCGKLLSDEEKFTTETGLIICKECYDAFQFDESSVDDTLKNQKMIITTLHTTKIKT